MCSKEKRQWYAVLHVRQRRTQHAFTALVVFTVFVLLIIVEVGAQLAAPYFPSQEGDPSGMISQSMRRKNLTPLRIIDTQEGSRVTIISDVPLNDYTAYRSGDRFFLVIPQTDAPRMTSNLRGRGFDEVKVEKRGIDLILSFRLQPGTMARVD